MGVGGGLEEHPAIASKAAGEAARLAGLFHVLHLADEGLLAGGDLPPVPLATWRYAEVHQRWQLAETLRLVGAPVDRAMGRARRILEWAQRKPAERPVLAARDVVAARLAQTVVEARSAFVVLEQHGWARRLLPEGSSRTSRWELHPHTFGAALP